MKIEEFFRGRVKNYGILQGVKLEFSQNSSGVDPYSSGENPNFIKVMLHPKFERKRI